MDNLKYLREIIEAQEEAFVSYKAIFQSDNGVIFRLFDMNKLFMEISGASLVSQTNDIGAPLYSDELNEEFDITEELNQIIKQNDSIVHNKFLSSLDKLYRIKLTMLTDDIVGVFYKDITNQSDRDKEQIIMRMAYYDDLTGLPNRHLLSERLKDAIAIANCNGTKLAILYIDMDNFKIINDTLGHSVGDELLKEAANRLKRAVREKDTVARISGDQFALLITNVKSIEKTIPLIERIINEFTESFSVNNRLINMTASIGVAIYPDDGVHVEDLMRSCDTAMYKSKDLGKNRYQFYNVSMKKELLLKLNIEGMLNKALELNEFVLYYQPQINTVNSKLRGFEALIRWNNPEMGFLMPVDFIAIAEEVGLISQIGEWVLNEACLFNSKENKIYNTEHIIAVNISPIQLKQKNFYEVVVNAIYNSGIKPENLELEVTENIFIDNFDFAVKVLNDLKNLGVRIALDDFGTGYSSLSYLKKLPINLLKIDKTFVREINKSDNSSDLTKPIISIAHNLDIETLAEGVEEKFQLDFLVNADCDNIQGYYFGKPISEKDIFENKLIDHLI